MPHRKQALPIYFGGSFNPFHKGHAAIVSILHQNFPDSEIILLPNSLSPFKIPAESSALLWPTTEQKKTMMQIALNDLKADLGSHRLLLEDYELRQALSQPCYTADTLQAILPETSAECHFALGWDSFVDLHKWKNWPYLVEHCHFLVFQRSALGRAALESQKQQKMQQKIPGHPVFQRARFRLFALDAPVSSSELRSLYASAEYDEKQIGQYLSPAVAAYIAKLGLYRKKLAH